MEVAASTLGHLVKSGGALTADIVEFEAGPLFHGFGMAFGACILCPAYGRTDKLLLRCCAVPHSEQKYMY